MKKLLLLIFLAIISLALTSCLEGGTQNTASKPKVVEDVPGAYIQKVRVDLIDDLVRFNIFYEYWNKVKGVDIFVGVWIKESKSGVYITNNGDEKFIDSGGLLYAFEKSPFSDGGSSYVTTYIDIPRDQFFVGNYNYYPHIEIQYGSTRELLATYDIGEPFFSVNRRIAQEQEYNNDTDHDGLSDEVEFYIAESYVPIYFFDKQEDTTSFTYWDGIFSSYPMNNENEPKGVVEFNNLVFLYQVTPGNCTGEKDPFFQNSNKSDNILVTYVMVTKFDYVPMEGITTFGGETDIFSHYGDTERLRICLRKLHLGEFKVGYQFGNYEMVAVNINRHGHKGGHLYSPDDFEKVMGDDERYHIAVFVSEGKHGVYKSDKECEAYPSGKERSVWDEDCSDFDENPIKIHPTIRKDLNVGEYYHKAFTTTGDVPILSRMFAVVEFVWAKSAKEDYFCGGFFVKNPFEKHSLDIDYGYAYSEKMCAGGLNGKWFERDR